MAARLKHLTVFKSSTSRSLTAAALVGSLVLPGPVRVMGGMVQMYHGTLAMCRRTWEGWWRFSHQSKSGTPSPHRRPPLMSSHQQPLTTRWEGGFTILSRSSTEMPLLGPGKLAQSTFTQQHKRLAAYGRETSNLSIAGLSR